MTHTTTLRELLLSARRRLETANVDAPRLSAELLLCHALGLRRLDIIMDPQRPVAEEEQTTLRTLIDRRAQGEPLAYILGVREFYGRDFAVTPATLIPRPETEHLIETALSVLRPGAARFVDAGTGSGCIAVTLCAEREDLSGLALDRSPGALAAARANAMRHGVADRLSFALGDFTTRLLRPRSLDLYVSNPPYISADEHASLSHEVREFEPRTALVPGDTGMEHAAAIVDEAACALASDGVLLMEFGCTQGDAVAALFRVQASRWTSVDIRQDLAGLDRFVFARRSTRDRD